MLKAIMTFIFSLQTVAWAAPIYSLKDFSVNQINENKIEVVYKKETISLEKIDNQMYLLNGQKLKVTTSDTLDQVHIKLEKAYKDSQRKKVAGLSEMLVPQAHAFPLIMAALAGGFFGFAMRDAACRNKYENGGNQNNGVGVVN